MEPYMASCVHAHAHAHDCTNARPTKMKAFKNREGIDFDLAEELECVQEWELPEAPPENTTGIE